MKCPDKEKCVWVDIFRVDGKVKYMNSSTDPTEVCECLHPDESEYDMLVRIGHYDTTK